MGCESSLCSGLRAKYASSEPQSTYSNLDDEAFLNKFNEISNCSEIKDLEMQTTPFQFTWNYYFDSSSPKLTKIPINFDDLEFSKSHSVASPLVGSDNDGTWVYIGECLTGTKIKDGRGFLIHLEKRYKFQGHYKNDETNGRGRLVTCDKLQEGDWLNDEIIGEGIEICKDGSIYTGKFSDGLYESLGKITFADHASYSGEFSKGERQGYGEYQWPDGSRFIGNWKAGKFHGLGKYLDSQGSIFEGGWKENQMDGYGEYIWHDGRKYKGNYYRGKKHGYGEMYWPDGNVWRGSWKNGRQHGRGEMFIKSSGKRNGTWYEGKFVSWQE